MTNEGKNTNSHSRAIMKSNILTIVVKYCFDKELHTLKYRILLIQQNVVV